MDPIDPINPTPLEQIIRERITREGPIPFAAFMQMALYHPQGGYYMSDGIRIGPEGDYVTASHLHPIFGWLLAVQMDEMKRAMGDPREFCVLEVGAGKGYLAEGILDYVVHQLKWKKGWRYIIIEKNPSVVEVQKKILGRYADHLSWNTSLDHQDRLCGCIISNELLDAFPVHLLHRQEQYQEIFVGIGDRTFEETDGDLSHSDLAAYIKQYGLPEIKGYRTEVNLAIRDYLADADRILSEGFVITIDYGYSARDYYSPDRRQGTLLSYTRHTTRENPFVNVGHQDITAHVNFTSLKDWGARSGLQTIGYCSQGAFLASLGIDKLISNHVKKNKTFQQELLKIKSLLFGIGDSHQVMIQYKGRGNFTNPSGFALSNRIGRL